MNTLQRYMVLNSLVLVVIPVMSQQKEDKEIKLNEETVKKPKGYIRMCPYSIWTKRGEDPVYDVTVEGRPPELIMNEGPDVSKKLQTDYGHSLKPSTGRTYDMLNNSTPIEVGKIFKKYIKPLLPAKKSK